MDVARSAGEVAAEHTTLELECIDRMYRSVYVPMLQAGAGAVWFFRKVRRNPVPSSALTAADDEPLRRAAEPLRGRRGVHRAVSVPRISRGAGRGTRNTRQATSGPPLARLSQLKEFGVPN